jgi:hypothetical protein
MQAKDVQGVVELGEESVRIAREVGDIATFAYAATPLAVSMLLAGDEARAAPLLDEALAATRAVGNRRQASRTLWALGRLAVQRGEPARALFEEACGLCREFGDGVFLTLALPHLAEAELAEGRPEVAVRLLAAATANQAATGAAWISWMHEDRSPTRERGRGQRSAMIASPRPGRRARR